jgi:hypothetical protein
MGEGGINGVDQETSGEETPWTTRRSSEKDYLSEQSVIVGTEVN